MNSALRDISVGIAAIAMSPILSTSARACAVCAGDPQSPLAQGARQGILTMLIITYVVVIGFAGMFAVTIVRSRRMALAQRLRDQVAGDISDDSDA